MEVSIWWVVLASFLGVSTGFMLCAVLTIAQDAEDDDHLLASGANVQRTLV